MIETGNVKLLEKEIVKIRLFSLIKREKLIKHLKS